MVARLVAQWAGPWADLTAVEMVAHWADGLVVKRAALMAVDLVASLADGLVVK